MPVNPVLYRTGKTICQRPMKCDSGWYSLTTLLNLKYISADSNSLASVTRHSVTYKLCMTLWISLIYYYYVQYGLKICCFATAIQFSSRFTSFQLGSKKDISEFASVTVVSWFFKAYWLTSYFIGNPSNPSQCFGNPAGPLADSMFPECSLLR